MIPNLQQGAVPSPGFPQMNEGPPGGTNMPGGMPPYFTVSNLVFGLSLVYASKVARFSTLFYTHWNLSGVLLINEACASGSLLVP